MEFKIILFFAEDSVSSICTNWCHIFFPSISTLLPPPPPNTLNSFMIETIPWRHFGRNRTKLLWPTRSDTGSDQQFRGTASADSGWNGDPECRIPAAFGYQDTPGAGDWDLPPSARWRRKVRKRYCNPLKQPHYHVKKACHSPLAKDVFLQFYPASHMSNERCYDFLFLLWQVSTPLSQYHLWLFLPCQPMGVGQEQGKWRKLTPA